jgi:hypothetical protein
MIKLFGEIPFKKIENTVLSNLKERINRIDDNELLSLNLEILADEQTKKSEVKILDVNLVDRKYQVCTNIIKGYELPNGFDVQPNKNTSRAQVFYSFEIINGDVELFSVNPKTAYISEPISGNISKKEFSIYYQTTSQNEILNDKIKEDVIKWRNITLRELSSAITDVNSQVEKFNKALPNITHELINKKFILAKAKKDQDDELK